jgi:TonB-linked SusC/RagA family outer membrane protein
MHFKSGGKTPSGLLLRNILMVMKLIAFLLVTALLHMCTPARSQRVNIAGNNLSLEKVFMEIRKQTGVEFIYESALLKATHAVTLDVKNMRVEEVLQRCLQGQGLGFNVRSNTIILFKEEEDTQTKEPVNNEHAIHLTGRVVDAQGLPVAMASVVLVRTNEGTQTNQSGTFILKVNNLLPTDSLLISFVGLTSNQLGLNSHTDAGDIMLTASDNVLDEAMVIAYGTTSERFRTGDITTVKAVDIEKMPALNLVEALAGRVPGLYIRQTGSAPSSVYNIQLRGYNIIPQDLTIDPREGVQTLTRPLFVLDGLPMLPEVIDVYGRNNGTDALTRLTGAGGGQDPLYWLNAVDVESISVLKDAEATSLYGSRATNGVIMITTKKGKPGKTAMHVTFNTGVNVLARRLTLLNTQQYLAMRHEAWNNTMRAGLPVYGPSGNLSYTPNADNSFDLFVWDTTRYTDWQQVLLGSAPNYNAHLELSGGQIATYRLSAGYNSAKAPYPTVPGKKPFKEERGTMTLKVASHSLNNRFKLTAAVNTSIATSEQPADNPDDYIFLIPNAPAMQDKAGNINLAEWRTLPDPHTANPLQILSATYHSNRFYLQVNTSLSYELFRSLVFTVQAGYTKYDGRQLLRRPASAGAPGSSPPSNSSYFGNSMGTGLTLEPNLRYEFRQQRHHVVLQAGASFQSDKQEGSAITASGYASEKLMDNLAGATSYTTDVTFVQRRAVSGWGRVTYRYAGKYLADVSVRRDGSSTFGPNNRYGNFGSAGLGWIFTEEAWGRNWPLLTFGKLRGSYGITGNQNIRPYAYYSTFRPDGTYNGGPSLTITRAANPTLGWVQAHSADVGMDLYFLTEQRLKFTIQWYRKITGDQLITDTISEVTGTNSYLHNLPAKVSNSGWELMIDYRSPARHSQIYWDVHFNIAANKNKLLSYPDLENNSSLKVYFTPGQPLYRQYLLPATLDKTLGVYTYYPPANQLTVYKAVDDNPAFTGGLQAGIHWKGLSLSVSGTFAKQKGFHNVQGAGSPGFLPAVPINNQPLAVIQQPHWQSPTDAGLGGAFYATGRPSQVLDIYWGNASYIAVKNAALTYQLPATVLRKAFLNNLNFYVRTENLLFIPVSGYQGMNPEQPSLIYKQLPLRMTVVTGFTINI